jgi:hypothetical protein
MNATEAANFLINKMRRDIATREVVQAVCAAHGAADIVALAMAEPDKVILLAESEADVDDQEAVFESTLDDVAAWMEKAVEETDGE